MITKEICSFSDWIAALDLTEEENKAAQSKYNRIIEMCEGYAQDHEGKDIVIYMYPFRDSGGHQFIAEGSVTDRSLPSRPSYNWHLQNTSQWLFAYGCVFDKERRDFSIHT